ncbi:TetR family transcriptional regulator [Sinomonas sp. ASV322]|uniref:TetR/AcrR family transcriptional regulator n=1 Tax=Sinomonas sp. ASV322 TaxID=3041920 RepID=UPI0027DDC90D|nr:TetR family transcriptional regulator [Sinomonas sp. ASV322]MDQ4501190.1 TetR family transcriptional regulator [Sinomonas sp. ASV322]
MAQVKRSYRSPIREQQAALTRARIVEAAAAEFSERGWSATTLAGIAERAGVTPQAVHLAVGAKPALLRRAIETTVSDGEGGRLVDSGQLSAVLGANTGIDDQLAALARAHRQIYERAAPLFAALEEAAAADPDAAELLRLGGDRRLADMRRIARRFLPNGSRSAIATAADELWVLGGQRVYLEFVHRRGWSSRRYEAWLARQLRAAFSSEQDAPPPSD